MNEYLYRMNKEENNDSNDSLTPLREGITPRV